MDKRTILRSTNPYTLVKEMEVVISDSQVTFTMPELETFRLNKVKDAKKLRDMLDVWIAYQKL